MTEAADPAAAWPLPGRVGGAKKLFLKGRCSREAGGPGLGCNIRLPRELEPNPCLDKFIEFEHFFIRKVMLVMYSSAFVLVPGGCGTLDEDFEVVTPVQSGKLVRFPVVGMGGDCWHRLCRFARDTMLKEGVISSGDLDFIHTAASPDKALQIIQGR